MAGFAVSVRLIDLATGPLAKINQAIFGTQKSVQTANSVAQKSSTRASVAAKSVASNVSASANESAKKSSGSLHLFKDALRDVGKETREVGEGFLKAFSPFETLAIGLSSGGIIAGLGLMAQNFASVGSATLRMSQSLGLNVVDLQNWRGAAELAGVGADAMTNSLQGVSHGIYMARNGLNPEMFRAAQQFGIDLNKGATDAERAANVLLQISDRIRNDPLLKGNVQAQHTLLSVFGIDDKTLPMLQRGRAEIEKYIEEARRHGYLTEQQTEAAAALQRAYTGLRLSIESTSLAIGAQMSQWLTPMLTAWSDWLDKLRATPGALGSIKQVLEGLGGADWAKVGADLAHGLLGDGGAWQTTGSKLMDAIVKGMISANDAFSAFTGKMLSVTEAISADLAKAASGFASALLRDISDSPEMKKITSVFEELGKVSGSVFANDLIKSLVDTLKSDPDVAGITDFFSSVFSNTDWMPDWLNKLTGGRARGVGGTPGYGAKPAGPLDPKREAEAMDYLQKNLNLTTAQASGVVSTLEQESSLDPTARNASGHFGIAQWDQHRQQGLHGSTSFEDQLAYVVQELKTTEAEHLAKIRAATTPEASSVAMRGFERGGDYGGKDITRARMIYNAQGPVGNAAAVKPPTFAVPETKKPVGAPAVMTSPAGEMITLPEVTVTAPAPKPLPIPPLVPGGGGAGKQGSLNLDSSHTVQVHFVNAPAGMRSGLTQAEGPASVAVRTQYAMDNLS